MGGRRWEVGLRVGGRGRGEERGWGRGSRGEGFVAQLNQSSVSRSQSST